MTEPKRDMTLLTNTLWNALGLVIPSLMAIPAMAILARSLGVEMFGLFMLCFSLLGYAGVFDGGLTRAVIRSIAMHDDDEERNRDVVGTASCAVLVLGAVGAIVVFFGAARIADLMNVSTAASGDTVRALKILAFAIPVYSLSLVWFAYLEGKQQFLKLNMLKTFTGLLVAMFPAMAVLIRPSLSAALVGLLLARIATLMVAHQPCRRGFGKNVFHFKMSSLGALLRFGGWITVSNIISPLMVYVDRYILAYVMGASRVAFYAAPSEVVARLSFIPGAAARTIFPLFSKLQDSADDAARSAFRGLLFACIAVSIPIFLYAEWLLTIWLGEPYGDESVGLLRILLIGFIFSAVAQVPYSRIQAQGKSKVTALVHALELVPYLALLTFLIHEHGLIGAAIAWTARVIVDFLALEILSRRLVK